MALDRSHRQLTANWQTLNRAWTKSRAEWSDAVRDRFASDYWAPIQSSIPSLLESLDDLARAAEDARREVR